MEDEKQVKVMIVGSGSLGLGASQVISKKLLFGASVCLMSLEDRAERLERSEALRCMDLLMYKPSELLKKKQKLNSQKKRIRGKGKHKNCWDSPYGK